jgi:hypothetical protein
VFQLQKNVVKSCQPYHGARRKVAPPVALLARAEAVPAVARHALARVRRVHHGQLVAHEALPVAPPRRCRVRRGIHLRVGLLHHSRVSLDWFTQTTPVSSTLNSRFGGQRSPLFVRAGARSLQRLPRG